MKTIDLERMIKKTKRFHPEIIEENPPPMLSIYIQECLEKKKVKRSALIRALNMDRNYGYQILNGTRAPTRRQVVMIGIYLGLELEDVQRMLTISKRDILYVRRPEDARAIYCIEHKVKFGRACEFIWGDK